MRFMESRAGVMEVIEILRLGLKWWATMEDLLNFVAGKHAYGTICCDTIRQFCQEHKQFFVFVHEC
jgi:hypothetical protein